MSIEVGVGGVNRKTYYSEHGKPVIVVGTSDQGLGRQAQNETYPQRRPDVLRTGIPASYMDRLRTLLHINPKTTGRV